jgi:membrane-associated phospholipid phosphatase
MTRRTFLAPFAAVDALVIVFLLLIGLAAALWGCIIHDWVYLLPANIATSTAIAALAFRARDVRNRLAVFIHTWYPIPAIFYIFKEIYVLIQSLALKDWEDVLIACDRAIFGGDPTVWLSRMASPALTELLQIAYVSYYVLMIALGVELALRRDREKLAFTVFTITYGFILSYIGYCLFPAVGPRFTLHDFTLLDKELPGLLFTEPFRSFVNTGESIPQNVAHPILFAQRDAFPSGHTEMTLIVMYLGHHYRIRSRWILSTFGTLLIISTVYLRYHYVTDLIGGAFFMIFTLWTAPKLVAWWDGLRRARPGE